MARVLNTIVLIGWRRYAIQRAKELGLSVIYIEHIGRVSAEDSALADEIIEMDYREIEKCVQQVKQRHEQNPVQLVISFAEDGLIPAAKCNEALGIDWNHLDTIELLKDKGKMRAHLLKNDFSATEYRIGNSIEEIQQFYHEWQQPFIIKPIDGTASQNLYLIRSEKDLDHFCLAQGELHEPVLLEEYLEGEEFSIETMSFHGEHVVLAITDKRTFGNFVEQGHTLPTELSPKKKVILEAFVKEFLTIVELKEGPAHTEVKWTPKGPRIIESHNRIGGDKINELYKLAYGQDMLTMTFAWATGQMAPMKEAPPPIAAASIQFITLPPGRVVAVEGVEEVRKQPFVSLLELSAKIGSEIKELKSSYERVGCIICSGKTPEEAKSYCKEMIQKLNIKTVRE